ncbi:MAG: hypothetical protein JNK32_03860 [Anaerolineales bacterium]|nr:hypothetical protein [Anaerolineales bacterium]
MPTIVFNGKTYNSIEDMPANERQAFEQMSKMFVDQNGNGIPDFLEGDMVQKVLAAHSTNMHVSVNGKTYHTLEDLPPDLRQSVDGAFQILSSMGMLSNLPETQSPQVQREAQIESKPFVAPQSSAVIEEDRGSNLFPLIIGGIVLCFALAVAAIAVFYFMGR